MAAADRAAEVDVLNRRAPLSADPEKTRAWQQRSQQAAAQRAREKGGTPLPKVAAKPKVYRRKPRRNDGAWHDEVMLLRQPRCRSCGGWFHVQADHMIPRSQGGPSILQNGLVLCGEFGDGKCHVLKTEHKLLIQRDWLDDDQIEWLQASGNAWWEEDGTVSGRHCRLFAPVRKG